MTLLGNHRPGTSLLHRAPAGAKLAGLMSISLVSVVWRSAETTTVLLAVCVLGFAVAQVGLLPIVRTLRRLLVVIFLVGAYQVWQRGWEQGYTIVGNIVGLVLLATLLTSVTSIDDMLDTITRMLRPFRRFGVNPELVSLAFSLMMRAIPMTMETGRETRHAALARGLDRSPRAHMTPLVIRTVAQARTTGDALFARGVVDDD